MGIRQRGRADDESQGQGQVGDGAPSLEAILVQESDSGDLLTPAWLSDGQARLVVPRDQTPSDDLAFHPLLMRSAVTTRMQ